MNDHNNPSSGSSPDVPPPLPSQVSCRPGPSASARIATPSPNPQPPARPQPAPAGCDEPLPAGVKGWCWGGFLLNWIWAIRFRVWWGLLALVPLVGLAVPIWLGIKGRELAWRRGVWTSVQAFNEAQRKWSIAGTVVTALACLGYGGSFAYERWQAHRAEASAEGSGMTQEQMAKIISAPVDLKQLGVPAPEQPAPTVRGEVNVGDTLPARIETSNGALELRTLPDQSSALFLGGQRLFNGDDAKFHVLVLKFQRSDGSEVVLLRSAGGRGLSCEALYFFVVVYRNGIRYSPEFGSCTPAINYEQRGDTITLTMPRMGGMSVYRFEDDDKVFEDGKPVAMRDDVDPSK